VASDGEPGARCKVPALFVTTGTGPTHLLSVIRASGPGINRKRIDCGQHDQKQLVPLYGPADGLLIDMEQWESRAA
jgi:hypothetical protein